MIKKTIPAIKNRTGIMEDDLPAGTAAAGVEILTETDAGDGNGWRGLLNCRSAVFVSDRGTPIRLGWRLVSSAGWSGGGVLIVRLTRLDSAGAGVAGAVGDGGGIGIDGVFDAGGGTDVAAASGSGANDLSGFGLEGLKKLDDIAVLGAELFGGGIGMSTAGADGTAGWDAGIAIGLDALITLS